MYLIVMNDYLFDYVLKILINHVLLFVF